MTKEQPDYLSYLLRLWRVDGQSSAGANPAREVWRASLESPFTHERQGFASLDELFDFLKAQTGVTADGINSQTVIHKD